MDPFGDFPDEMIFKVCSGMTTEDLNKFVRSNTKYYKICKEILQKREKEFFSKYDIGFEIVFKELKSREKVIDEYWKAVNLMDGRYDDVYIKGNIYRAVLIFDKYGKEYYNSNQLEYAIGHALEELEEDYTSISPRIIREEINTVMEKVVGYFIDQYSDIYLKKSSNGPILL